MAISKREMEIRNNRILDCAFELFVSRTIESVSMQNIADTAKVGIASVYRYYPNKPELVIAVASKKWTEYFDEIAKKRSEKTVTEICAIDRLEYFYDQCIELYCDYKELLVFNNNFQRYIVNEKIDESKLVAYRESLVVLNTRLQWMYEHGKSDDTIRTDIPMEKFNRIFLHPMLATCGYYARGILWEKKEEEDYKTELLILKDMLLSYAKGN